MNLTDGIGIVIMLLSILIGVRRGFIFSALELLCWAGSLVLGFLLYAPLSRWFQKIIATESPWYVPAAFLLLLIVSRILLETVAGYLLKKVPEKTHTHFLNKFFGVIPGAVSGFLWIAALSILLLLAPFGPAPTGKKDQSRLTAWVVEKSRWLGNYLSPVFTGIFTELTPKRNAALSKQQSINLPFTVKNGVRRPDLEERMLEMVNEERVSRNLAPLKADPEIAVPAYNHAVDMFARGYFSHLTPEGKTPFERIREAKVFFLTAGENLAFAQTLEIAHEGLMNSPGHKANILRPAFGRLGIGIVDGGVYGLMITQNFRD